LPGNFSSLEELLPSGQQSSLLTPASGAQSSSPLATAVSQLAPDLKSGNTAATHRISPPSSSRSRVKHIIITITAAGNPASPPASRTPPLKCSANSASNCRRAIYRVPNRPVPQCSWASSSSLSTILPRPRSHPSAASGASFRVSVLARLPNIQQSVIPNPPRFLNGVWNSSPPPALFWHSGSSLCSCFSTPGLKTGLCVV